MTRRAASPMPTTGIGSPRADRPAPRWHPACRLGPQSEVDFAEFNRSAVAMTGAAGDLLLYIGQAWHTIGLNEARLPRAALLGQGLPYYFKPSERRSATATHPA